MASAGTRLSPALSWLKMSERIRRLIEAEGEVLVSEIRDEDPDAAAASSLNPRGWLTFVHGTGVRRLRLYPVNWAELPADRLQELYRRAR